MKENQSSESCPNCFAGRSGSCCDETVSRAPEDERMDIKARFTKNAYGHGFEVWAEIKGENANLATRLTESQAKALSDYLNCFKEN